VRLPGAGGAPEIAASCRETVIVVPHSRERFVEKLDFVTSVGHGSGPESRERLGLLGGGPSFVITDLGILEPDPETLELVVTHLHPGVSPDQIKAATSWALRLSPALATTPPPSTDELAVLRELERTRPGGAR
jgi:glutaconate CoA-transferase subunit B